MGCTDVALHGLVLQSGEVVEATGGERDAWQKIKGAVVGSMRGEERGPVV